MVNGTMLVIAPLLVLTADQVAKIGHAIQKHGSVKAYHLDDTTPSQIRDDIIPQLNRIKYDSSLTMFLLSLTQYLVEHPSIIDAIMRCHAIQTLQLVTIDEAHL